MKQKLSFNVCSEAGGNRRGKREEFGGGERGWVSKEETTNELTFSAKVIPISCSPCKQSSPAIFGHKLELPINIIGRFRSVLSMFK